MPHGKIDAFHAALFVLQNFLKPFRKSGKELNFSIAFTARWEILLTY